MLIGAKSIVSVASPGDNIFSRKNAVRGDKRKKAGTCLFCVKKACSSGAFAEKSCFQAEKVTPGATTVARSYDRDDYGGIKHSCGLTLLDLNLQHSSNFNENKPLSPAPGG